MERADGPGHSAVSRDKHEERFRHLVQGVTGCAIFMLDLNGHITSWNAGAGRLSQYAASEVIGRHIAVFYTPEDRAAGKPADILQLAAQTGRFVAEDWRMRRDGSRFWAHILIEAMADDQGKPIGFAVITRDMTWHKEDAERISSLISQDDLTGLMNRRAFYAQLGRQLAERRAGQSASLLLIDLDGFAAINDRHGHAAGDEVLTEVATRLRAVLRAGDVAGRVGGDSFGILLDNAAPRAATLVAERLIGTIERPITIADGNRLTVSACIGLTSLSRRNGKPDAVLAQAGLALHEAKAHGRAVVRAFSPALRDRLQPERRLADDLRDAVETASGLQLHYQPIQNIANGAVTAREALMRWTHHSRGAVPPSVFIPAAEATGLIVTLGIWALRTACRAASGWPDQARVAVNVSALQLGAGFADHVHAALREAGLPPSRLELEITESSLLDDGSAGRLEGLHRLHQQGVKITLDDFGVGFSSLAHIRAFPFDRIKIDGSFVRDAVSRPDCAVIVGTVADLGRRLGIVVVAEGVETQEQLELVQREGCHEVQGFLIGRPGVLAGG
jgi:diguanylate cyclase (GGDEF)-like protein/PAS domain S-box-containing protein